MSVLKSVLRDRVFQIATLFAMLSLFFARPHIRDINFTTLWSLLGMMTVIQIFEYLHVLDFLAYHLTAGAKTARQLTLFFVILAFVASMFLTNDMAVLTFMPLYLRIARKLKLPQVLPATIITLAANLGSFMTPFGNSHNIYLMTKFHIPIGDYALWVLPLLAIAIVFLLVITLFVTPIKLPVVPVQRLHINMRPTIITAFAAVLVFASVFGIVPAWVAAGIVILLAFAFDPKIMKHVDYAIVFTFLAFFILVSDIQQIPVIVRVLSQIERDPVSVYLTSIVVSQGISNVPATVLVAQFTHQIPALFYGTNVGGLGTMIASLCNLLAFKQFRIYASHDVRKKFFWPFTLINFVALFVVGGVCLVATIAFSH